MSEAKLYSTPDLYYDFSTTSNNLPSEHLSSEHLSSEDLTIDCVAVTCTQNRNNPPYPVIIMAIIGFVLAIYTAIGIHVNSHLRSFGAIFIFLWTIMWCLILWVLWKASQYTETWGLLILPLALIFLFFMIIIVDYSNE